MSPQLPTRVEHWPLDRLLPYAANARTHSDEQVRQLAGSIAGFGFNVPCLVDDQGVLIAGHGRLLAARQLGLVEVPVIRLGHLSEADARAYRLADNRIALNASWDEPMLSAELARLRDDGLDLDLLGFDDAELDRLLAPLPDDGADAAGPAPLVVPETPRDPVCQLGDLWILGRHRLLCGDSTKPDDVRRLMQGETASMCFTDSPYNVDYAGGVAAERLGVDRRILNDNLGDGFGEFLRTACTQIMAHTRGAIYMCMSSSELHTLHQAFIISGGHWSTFIIWAKDRFTLGRADYQRQYEPILYGWPKGIDHHWCGDRDQGDVWYIDRPAKNDLHPTMKPVALVERAITNSSRRGDIVLDPFGGSGTTLIACEQTGRRSNMLELDPVYCDVIINRWQGMTGNVATHDATGQSYSDICAEKENL